MKTTLILLTLLAAGPAAAQEAIPTNSHAPRMAAPDPAAGPLLVPDHPLPDPVGPVFVGPCGQVSTSTDGTPPPPDAKPHGEVFAGVGTGGYREAGGYVCQPLKNGGEVSIAVDAGRINGQSGGYYQARPR